MTRFLTYAVPMLLLLFASFGFAVDMLDLEPRSGAIVKLPIFEQNRVSGTVVLGIWLMEACGLLALFLMAQGRCGAWWLDGLISGWLAWIFRGPLLVLTVVVAARHPQGPWWDVAFGWWILYSICGLSLAYLARASGLGFEETPAASPALPSPEPEAIPESTEDEAQEAHAAQTEEIAPDPDSGLAEGADPDDSSESSNPSPEKADSGS